MTAVAIRFENITKRFPGVQALSDVSLEIRAGSCHALCGENGAGKSTLGKILAGVHGPDEGRLFIHGTAVRFGSPHDALAAGVGMVHQELAFCGNLSVAENLCLSDLPSRRGFVSRGEMRRRATVMLEAIGASLDVSRLASDLSIAQLQMVQIASAVGGGARILVFDEPTSSLSYREVEQLYALIDRLKAAGVTCIYVSHRMPELFRLCDAVSVLRDGRHVATRAIADVTEQELVGLMVGRQLDAYFPPPRPHRAQDEALRVEHLTVPGEFEDVSFSLDAGEILGLAGLVGAGRSEIAAALFGLTRPASGGFFFFGRPVVSGTPSGAIRLGIGLVPEDRKKQGLVLSESALHNTSLPVLGRFARLGWVLRGRERRAAVEYHERLGVRGGAAGLDAVVAGLSGGNQQKIVLAKWLTARSRVLILDEPTRGVDVGAKAQIHTLIGDLAAHGTAILLISSELPELLALSERILVVRNGQIVGALSREEATQDRLLRMMAGLPEDDKDLALAGAATTGPSSLY